MQIRDLLQELQRYRPDSDIVFRVMTDRPSAGDPDFSCVDLKDFETKPGPDACIVVLDAT